MKRTILVVGILLGVMLAGAAVFWGCNREDANRREFLASHPSDTVQSGLSPRPDTIIGPAILSYQSAAGKRIIDSTSKTSLAESYLNIFGLRGYSFSAENSFVAIGKGVPDGRSDSIDVVVTTLALKYPTDSMAQVCYISVARSELGVFYAPWEVSFVYRDTADGFERIGDHLWVRSYEAIPELSFLRNPILSTQAEPLKWCWKCWGKCVAIGTASGCSAAATACIITGPGWGLCTGAWCAGAAVGSLVGCTLGQVL